MDRGRSGSSSDGVGGAGSVAGGAEEGRGAGQGIVVAARDALVGDKEMQTPRKGRDGRNHDEGLPT